MSHRIGSTGRSRIAAAILILFGAAEIGCSGPGSLTGPESAAPGGDPAGLSAILPAGNTSGVKEPVTPQKTGTVTRTRVIDADLGGEIQCGRYAVRFMPGALDTDTEIRVVDVSDARGYPCVELYPEGIHFNEPVYLSTRVPAATAPALCRMWWWAPQGDGSHAWTDIGGAMSADGLTISATLEHFSTYAPGKAGWWKPENPVVSPPQTEAGSLP